MVKNQKLFLWDCFYSFKNKIKNLIWVFFLVPEHFDSEDLLPLASLIPESSETAEEVIRCLGDDPNKPKNDQLHFHPELVSRWNTWLSQGISLEVKNILLQKYPLKGNCNLEPPKLNPENSSSLNETAKKRDSHFVDTQNLLGTAMAPLGLVISELLLKRKGLIG